MTLKVHQLSYNLRIEAEKNNMFNFSKRNPKTKLEGLDRAIEILNERYQQKQITIEQFQKQSEKFGKLRVKYQKELEKEERKNS